MTATVNFNITELPENEVWFANAAAWNNYWQNIEADVDFTAITTTVYVPVPYNTAYQPIANAIQQADGSTVVQVFPTMDMFTSLRAQLTALDTAVQTMRTELKNAGLITNAQA